jgi:hypothetical protein
MNLCALALFPDWVERYSTVLSCSSPFSNGHHLARRDYCKRTRDVVN